MDAVVSSGVIDLVIDTGFEPQMGWHVQVGFFFFLVAIAVMSGKRNRWDYLQS